MNEADIQTSKPDYIVFVPKNEPNQRGDTYNDHFQVFDKPDGRLFAAWTQASREGDPDQHIAFSKSTDKGATWTTPIVLAGSECRFHPHPIGLLAAADDQYVWANLRAIQPADRG